MLIDLHCHSTASDGVFPPQELVERAISQNIEILSLTDHDTIDGLEAARNAAAHKIILINGIELSCVWAGTTIHVLGYAFSDDCEPLIEACDELRKLRWQRSEQIAAQLAKVGFKDALSGAIKYQGNDSNTAPARPHFAEFLVEIGAVKDRQQAFDKYLAAGKIGDVKQFWPSFTQTMELLKKSDALISLAHPYHYGFSVTKLKRLVRDFVESGGDALEVINGMQNPEQIKVLVKIANEFNLSTSFGSDFHKPSNWSELGKYQSFAVLDNPLWSLISNKLGIK